MKTDQGATRRPRSTQGEPWESFAEDGIEIGNITCLAITPTEEAFAITDCTPGLCSLQSQLTPPPIATML